VRCKLAVVTELVDRTAERHAEEHTSAFEGQLGEAAAWTLQNTPEPGMMSGIAEARLLEALIVVGGARRVLEVGTFTGVGTLTMAAALAEGGVVTTLELNPETAAIAKRHFDASPYAERIELIVGNALDTLARLEGPFDLVYIDAWKADYPAYYDLVIDKLAPRGVLVADNLFRDGAVLDPRQQDPGTLGIRDFSARVQADPRVHNALLTIGDGVLVAWRAPDAP
jgi:predicted O-methyltransferase YrrM